MESDLKSKFKNRLSRIFSFLSMQTPESNEWITLRAIEKRHNDLIVMYSAIFETQSRTIKRLEGWIEIQSESIASFDRMDELREKENKLLKDEVLMLEEIKQVQDDTIRLLEKQDSLNDKIIVQLIDRLKTASQKYNDRSLICEEILTLREDLLVNDNVTELDS